ncbi:MAG TPA: helix-turn-helix transcriptional regulator [Pyrinomonadaceae bacterium]|jgi:transcriptional regulator with XRE-family HTH domain|nr:helix-turn-helix transcriptional regulator [Pyrinomonadaceae bacterium]
MFPHPLDRYRATAYIVRQFRKSLGLSQKDLGKKIGGNQGTISNVENHKHLAMVAADGQRPVGLDVFRKIAIDGLGLSDVASDALIWLTEPDKFDAKLGLPASNSSLPFVSPNSIEPAQLRLRSLELLKQAVQLATARDGEEKLIRMLTGWEEEHQITFRRKLLRMEKIPGQRLLVSKYPSHLTSEANFFDLGTPDEENRLSAEGKQHILELTEQRREIFPRNLKEYGERCIHSTESLKRYLTEDFDHPLSFKGRREHVVNLIKLLHRWDLFEVALAPSEPEMEFVIKCGMAASLRGTAREIRKSRGTVICGPLYIFWDDATSVYSFVVDFEHAWDKIPEGQRDKHNVIKQLKQLLDASTKLSEQ